MTSHQMVRRDKDFLRFAVLPACLFALGGCARASPRIDGAAGAPPSPSTTWPLPPAVRPPHPSALPPTSDAASKALATDSAAARKASVLSLTEVVALALENNPATRQSWETARAALDDYGSARGALYPNVNASLNLSRGGVGGFGFGGAGVDTLTGGTTRSGTSVVGGTGAGSSNAIQLTPAIALSYVVLDMGARAGTIESAKQQAIAANLVHNMTVVDIVLQTESALFSYLATRALRDAQRTALEEAQTDTAAAEARLRVGVGTLRDVLQARTALAQTRFQLVTDEGTLLAARGTLATAMGLRADARFEIPDFPGIAGGHIKNVAASVDTLINRALVLRPEVAESRAQAAALAAEIRVARSAGYPSLTLTSSGNYPQLGGSVGGQRRLNSTLVFGVQIPIFNGFSRQFDLAAARARYEAGLAAVKSTNQQVALQVFSSYTSLKSATERVAAAADLLASARQAADVALGSDREGVATIVDVLIARNALATARAEDIQARWEWRTALAQLAHDTGVLDTAGRPNLPLGVP